MTLVKSDVPKLLEAGLRAVFFETFEATVGDWERIASIIPSKSDTEEYSWLGSIPRMREFTDERMPLALAQYDYSIKNKTWESSIAVDRATLEDDRYGQIKLRVQGLAREAKRHVDEIIFTLLRNGFTTKCYDGKNFFAADHSEGESGVQSNIGSDVLSGPALQQAITTMMKYKDDRGKFMGIVPDLLVVPPDLQWTAMELLNSTYYPDLIPTGEGEQKLARNVLKGKLDLLVSPYLADTNDWFVLSTRGIIKPVIFQSRTPVEFAALEGESESGFMRDKYIYGVRARYNVGFGPWQMAYGSQVA